MATLEEALGKLAELEEHNKECLWAKADLLSKVVDAYGPSVIGQAADVLACSKGHIRLLLRMADCFTEDKRYPDIPWGIYLVSAVQDNPVAWLDKAVENRWSIRQLKDAVAETKDRPTPEEEALSLAKKLAGKLRSLAEAESGVEVLLEVRSVLQEYLENEADGNDD